MRSGFGAVSFDIFLFEQDLIFLAGFALLQLSFSVSDVSCETVPNRVVFLNFFLVVGSEELSLCVDPCFLREILSCFCLYNSRHVAVDADAGKSS